MIEIVVLAVATCVLAAGVLVHLIDVVWAKRLMVRRRVLVSLRSGNAVTGVLWVRRGRSLVLRAAQLLEPGAEPSPMDGDVVLDRDQIEFVQVAGMIT